MAIARLLVGTIWPLCYTATSTTRRRVFGVSVYLCAPTQCASRGAQTENLDTTCWRIWRYVTDTEPAIRGSEEAMGVTGGWASRPDASLAGLCASRHTRLYSGGWMGGAVATRMYIELGDGGCVPIATSTRVAYCLCWSSFSCCWVLNCLVSSTALRAPSLSSSLCANNETATSVISSISWLITRSCSTLTAVSQRDTGETT